MNNKGFTLVEIIGVVTLMAIISLVALPPIINQVNKKKTDIYNALDETIYAAGNLYVQNNSSKFSDDTTHYIKLQTLVDGEYLDSTIFTHYTNGECVKATYDVNKYTYSLVSTCEEG